MDKDQTVTSNDCDLTEAIALDLEKSKKNQMIITTTYFLAGLCILGYLLWANSHIKPALNESFVAKLISSHISVNILPSAQPKIEDYLVTSIPEMTGNLLDNLENDLPSIRKGLTTQILKITDKNLSALQSDAFVSFDELLNQHNNEIRATLVSLQDEEGKEQFINLLKTILVEQYNTDTRHYTEYLKDTFAKFEQRMDYLLNSPRDALSDEEKQERHAVILVLANIESLARGDYGQSTIIKSFSEFMDRSYVVSDQ